MNAVQSQARGKGEQTMPQLQFRQILAKQMFKNTIGVEVVPEVVPRRTRRQSNLEHKLLRRGITDGTWNLQKRKFNTTNTDYVHHRCNGCGEKKARTYCSCDPSIPLCVACHALHVNALN